MKDKSTETGLGNYPLSSILCLLPVAEDAKAIRCSMAFHLYKSKAANTGILCPRAFFSLWKNVGSIEVKSELLESHVLVGSSQLKTNGKLVENHPIFSALLLR